MKKRPYKKTKTDPVSESIQGNSQAKPLTFQKTATGKKNWEGRTVASMSQGKCCIVEYFREWIFALKGSG